MRRQAPAAARNRQPILDVLQPHLPARGLVLEVASGSGGPALYLVETYGCRVTGIDANVNAVATASRMATGSRHSDRVRFAVADVNARLPFDDETFDWGDRARSYPHPHYWTV